MTYRRLTIFTLACLAMMISHAESRPPEVLSEREALTDMRVISKLSNKKEAEDLARSLIKSGQNVRIIPIEENVKLKSISIGLFPSQEKALSVVQHLKSNNIEAFPYRVNSGKYRVHAGAMQEETHYWARFEHLLSLGYKRINTQLKASTNTHFYIVRELIENLPPPVLLAPTLKPNISKKTEPLFDTTLLFGRFKGEFNSWKGEGKQSSGNYFNASLSAKTKYKNQWDFIYGTRFDAQEQSSTNNIQRFEFQWLPTYFQLQEPHNVMQLGLIDGRWDNRKQVSLSDRLSSKILTRHLLDDEVIDRRRPIIGVKWQFTQKNYELQVIASPIFRPAKSPETASIWHPINQAQGAIMGLKSTSQWQSLVKQGSFASDKFQFGGIGIRMTHKIGQRTRATTIQYAPSSSPYYVLNTTIQRLIAVGSSVDDAIAASNGATFSPHYPHSAIFSWEEFGKISHFEITAATNTPYTTTSYQLKKALSIEWMLGFIYPSKNKNTHISSFFIGRRLNTQDDMLDRNTKLGLKGKIYQQTEGRHWKFGFDYQFDFDHLGLYLNPRINFEQNKYLKLSLYYQIFAGNQITDSGFHKDHSALGLSWQAVF